MGFYASKKVLYLDEDNTRYGPFLQELQSLVFVQN